MQRKKPAIIVISSHVVRGTVGNRAAAFALEVMGFPVWIVPTIVLPWHPGHGPAKRIRPSADQFEELITDLIQSPWLAEVGAVLSGYLGAEHQVATVAKLVQAVKQKNPAALYVLDPVIGDSDENGQGRLYVPEAQAASMREQLVPLADLATPNPFELGWLTDQGVPTTQEQLRQAALHLPVPKILATSAPAMMIGHIGNMLILNDNDRQKAHLAEHRIASGPPNGMGDLAAALMVGNLLTSKDPVDALQKTSASLYEVMAIAAREQTDELPLEASIGSIIRPHTSVLARTLLPLKT